MGKPRLDLVNVADAAALRAHVASMREQLAALRALVADATKPKGDRQYSRAFLRGRVRRRFQDLGAQLDALDAGAHGGDRG